MSTSKIKKRRKGLAVYLTKRAADATNLAGRTKADVQTAHVENSIGRLQRALTLHEMLSAYDPERHGEILMDFPPVGREAM